MTSKPTPSTSAPSTSPTLFQAPPPRTTTNAPSTSPTQQIHNNGSTSNVGGIGRSLWYVWLIIVLVIVGLLILCCCWAFGVFGKETEEEADPEAAAAGAAGKDGEQPQRDEALSDQTASGETIKAIPVGMAAAEKRPLGDEHAIADSEQPPAKKPFVEAPPPVVEGADPEAAPAAAAAADAVPQGGETQLVQEGAEYHEK